MTQAINAKLKEMGVSGDSRKWMANMRTGREHELPEQPKPQADVRPTQSSVRAANTYVSKSKVSAEFSLANEMRKAFIAGWKARDDQ